jgi:hypothetical protein
MYVCMDNGKLKNGTLRSGIRTEHELQIHQTGEVEFIICLIVKVPN